MLRSARSELLSGAAVDAPVRRASTPLAMLGWLVIATGLVCNDLAYTFFFTSGVWASARTHAVLWACDLVLVLCGVFLVKRSRVARAFDAAMVVVVTLALVLLVEVAFAGLRAVTRPADVHQGDFFIVGHQADARLGNKPPPSMRLTHARTFDGRSAFDATYTIDDHSRRVTPQSRPSDRDDYLMFFGCSYTFGIGVQDDETMPFYAAEAASRHHVYNYGFGGYGPHQMVAQLQNDGLRAEIAERSGIAVYTFIDHHIRRANGASDALWGLLWDGPFFTVDDAGRLVHAGGFRWDRPLQSFVNYAVSRSNTAAYFNRSFPPRRDAHIDLTARIIERARDTFAAKFGSDAFYVVLYPNAEEAPNMIARLERAHVKYLDYSRLFKGRGKELFIPRDRHPTAAAHRIVARRLAGDLGIAAGSGASE